MTVHLRRKGRSHGPATVHVYINQELGLRSIVRPKRSAHAHGKAHKVFENKLNQDFRAQRANQKWRMDFTCLFLKNHEVRHNCSVLDLYDRSVVASLTDREITGDLAIRALKKALEALLQFYLTTTPARTGRSMKTFCTKRTGSMDDGTAWRGGLAIPPPIPGAQQNAYTFIPSKC